MTRSRKKTPVVGMTTCESEKQDKRIANRQLRAAVRTAIAGNDDVMPELREVSDIWTFGKDGKQYLGDRHPELRRK